MDGDRGGLCIVVPCWVVSSLNTLNWGLFVLVCVIGRCGRCFCCFPERYSWLVMFISVVHSICRGLVYRVVVVCACVSALCGLRVCAFVVTF